MCRLVSPARSGSEFPTSQNELDLKVGGASPNEQDGLQPPLFLGSFIGDVAAIFVLHLQVNASLDRVVKYTSKCTQYDARVQPRHVLDTALTCTMCTVSSCPDHFTPTVHHEDSVLRHGSFQRYCVGP